MEMLEEGTYRGRASRAKLGKTSTGKEQVAVEFTFVDPPGRRMTWFGFFTEATFDRTIEALRYCGWTGTDLADFAAADGLLPPGMDQEVELVVEHDEYKGKVSAKIAWVNSGGGLALKDALSADQARSFAARMKGKILALDQSVGRKPAPQSKPAARPQTQTTPPTDLLDNQADGAPDGEDIPF
jgi:hypothetical protein